MVSSCHISLHFKAVVDPCLSSSESEWLNVLLHNISIDNISVLYSSLIILNSDTLESVCSFLSNLLKVSIFGSSGCKCSSQGFLVNNLTALSDKACYVTAHH